MPTKSCPGADGRSSARPARRQPDGGLLARAVLVAAVAATTLCPSVARAQPVTLPAVQLSPWQQDVSGTGVRFDGLSPFREPDGAAVFAPGEGNEVGNGRFEYKLDTNRIQWAADCTCYRYYVVYVRAHDTGDVTTHKFRAYPSGGVVDQLAAVKMTIRWGDAPDAAASAQISLPVAGAPGPDQKPLLQIEKPSSPFPVTLGGTTTIPIDLKNATSGMTVTVLPAVAIRSTPVSFWASPPAANVPETIAKGATQTMTIELKPRLWQAILASLNPSASETSHATLEFDLQSADPAFTGRDSLTTVSVPIRFTPSPVALFFSLLGGVVLGSLVPLVAYRRGPITKWLRGTLTALIVAVILELVGIFLVAYHSKFVVFDFNLDPWQTLPVLLLGIGNGLLGVEAAKRLKFIKEQKEQKGGGT